MDCAPQRRRLRVFCLAGLFVAGCGLSASQRRDISQWQTEAAQLGHPEISYIEDVNPGRALGFAFLPFGIAGFYVHRPGMGVTGILFWPASITWVAPMAYHSAHQYNYQEFRSKVLSLRQEVEAKRSHVSTDIGGQLDYLQSLREQGKITDSEYSETRKKILERLGPPLR